MTTTAAARLAAGRWAVDCERTTATFSVRHLGVLRVHGSIAVAAGELAVDAAGAPVRLRADLDLNSIDTGNARRDADLRKPKLLDIDDHPRMTYTAEQIRIGPDGWQAEGALRLRGTSCPLVLTGVALGYRVQASASFDRNAIGLRAPHLLIGRTVEISIDAWLTALDGTVT